MNDITTPLQSLIHFDFNNPIHLVAVLALTAILVMSVRALYKEVRRLFRKGVRSYGKLAAAGLFTAVSGGAMTDAYGIPSDIINALGMAPLFL